MESPVNEGGIPQGYWLGMKRRRNERRQLVVQVDYRGAEAVCLGRTVDLSESGLLMTTPEPLEPGTPVEVRFAVPVHPQAVTVQAKGTVVRANPGHSMAIRFTELDDADRDAIKRYLESGDSRR